MNIIEESFKEKKKEKNPKRVAHIILAFIVILIISIIGILIVMAYMENATLKVYLDGQINTKVKELLIIEEDGTVYVPIRDIAGYLGYISYSGDYTDTSEDKSKCYVQSEDEVANFSLNSDKVYKLSTTSGGNNSYFSMDKPVKAIEGKLYATLDGIQKAFNVTFSYDKETNRIVIYTMPYLIKYYANKILDYGYTEINSNFDNQKTILDGKLIVKKTKYGVIDADTGETIVEPKYDNIQYLPTTGDFIISNGKKMGLISKSGSMKVELLYDKLQLMDSDYGLYLTQNEGKYGFIDSKGAIKLYCEYNEIGIDISRFAKNDIKSRYILLNRLIPVRKDKYWGLYDVNGQQVVDFIYDSFGYIASSNKDAINLLIIPDYNVLVVCKDKKYGLINSSGNEVNNTRPIFDDIYMTITSGEKHYYMNFNDKTYEALGYLDSVGVKVDNKTSNKNNTSNTNQGKNQDESQDGNQDEDQDENQGENQEGSQDENQE